MDLSKRGEAVETEKFQSADSASNGKVSSMAKGIVQLRSTILLAVKLELENDSYILQCAQFEI